MDNNKQQLSFKLGQKLSIMISKLLAYWLPLANMQQHYVIARSVEKQQHS